MSNLDVVVNNFEKSGLVPQFKRQLPDGTLIDTDTSYLDLLNAQARLASTAQSIHGASDELKTVWAIAMKDFANALFHEGKYSEAMEKYIECLTASKFQSSTSSNDDTDQSIGTSKLENNIDIMVIPVLCNLAACCLKLKEWGKTIRFCEEALKLRPTCVKASLQCCKAMLQVGEYTQAMNRLNQLQKTILINHPHLQQSLKSSRRENEENGENGEDENEIIENKNENENDEETNRLLHQEWNQINDLIRQAKLGISNEIKAEQRQKKAMMKAFRQTGGPKSSRDSDNNNQGKSVNVTSNATSNVNRNNKDNEKNQEHISDPTFIQMLWSYVLLFWMAICALFTSTNDSKLKQKDI